MLKKLYLLFSSGLLLLYALIFSLGWTLFGSGEQRETIPEDIRKSPGGYRSFHFRYGGYGRGK